MTYRFDLREGLALLPTVGFAVTDNDSASLTFRTNGRDEGRGRLTVEDSHTNLTGFLGATLSRTTGQRGGGLGDQRLPDRHLLLRRQRQPRHHRQGRSGNAATTR